MARYVRVKTYGAYHYAIQSKDKWWHMWDTKGIYVYWNEAIKEANKLIG